MTYDYSKLEGKITEKFGSQDAFASALGISSKSLSDKLNNKTIWKQPQISKARELLSISEADTFDYFFKYKVQGLEQS